MTDAEFMTLAILKVLSFGGNPRRKSLCKYDWFGEHLVDRLTELLGP